MRKNELYRKIYKIYLKMDHMKWSLCVNINKEQNLIFEIWLYIESRSPETGRLSKASGKKQNKTKTQWNQKTITKNKQKAHIKPTIRLKKMLSINREKEYRRWRMPSVLPKSWVHLQTFSSLVSAYIYFSLSHYTFHAPFYFS